MLKQIFLIIAIKNMIETENLFLSYAVFPSLMIWEHRVETIVLTIKKYTSTSMGTFFLLISLIAIV